MIICHEACSQRRESEQLGSRAPRGPEFPQKTHYRLGPRRAAQSSAFRFTRAVLV